MADLKNEDIIMIKKHAASVNYGKLILDFRKGELIKIEHQEAELTRAGLVNRGNYKEGRNQ